MSKPLTKSKKRVKELGEVFTPPTLVEEMLDKLPLEVWAIDRTFLDPTCGTGNFLVAVVERKVKEGSTPLQALRTTFGIDIMDDNVRECRERLLEAAGNPGGGAAVVERNIIVADSLTIDWETAFGTAAEAEEPVEAIDTPSIVVENKVETPSPGPCRRRSAANPEFRTARRTAPRSDMIP
jgi:hypothetical protein